MRSPFLLFSLLPFFLSANEILFKDSEESNSPPTLYQPDAEENAAPPLFAPPPASKPHLKESPFLFGSEEEDPEQESRSMLLEPAPAESVGKEEPISSESLQITELPPKWYFAVKPGYYWMEENSMQQFFHKGGFTLRAELGCKVWGPLIVWVDGGYFHKEGNALGGPEETDILLATLTLGLKVVHSFNEIWSVYAGAGPRLFMMKLSNYSPFVRSEDNQIGIGGGFDAGVWIFPFARCQRFAFPRNLFIDLFADYSLKNLEIEEDEVSSQDFNVDVSGLTIGAGLGIRY